MKYLLSISYGVLAFMLSGCFAYNKRGGKKLPEVNPLAAYSFTTEDDLSFAPWWKSFDRPALNALIEQSLSQNYDLAQSVSVLRQAQSIVKSTRGGRYPQVDIEAGTSKDWEDGEAQRSSSDGGLALSWELDIWNRIRAAAKADEFELQARSADVDALKLSLSAEVANSYFRAVAARERIDLLQSQVRLDKELERLLQLRLDNGVGTNVDVLLQQVRVADSETLIPLAESELAIYENRLDVLLGETPDAKSRVSESESLKFDSALPAIGLPSALLLERPDLRSAYAELVAADYEIGTAIAERLPRITLGASYLYSDDSSFSGPVFSLLGSFVQPLLDWGARKAEVERNEALYEERLAAYTQLFLEAVEDVENALIQEIKQSEFLEKLTVQRDLLQRTVDAAEKRYTQGIDDYQPVISALQELRSVERNMITAKLDLLSVRVDLFRAIGGPINSKSETGSNL
ncbi:efflux transporter outer membrane subunit [Puniceicoccaceae bacterium K14]|nr:efflux transporter outer membrane subunit [Puniceicoccaceae bacterium K14]